MLLIRRPLLHEAFVSLPVLIILAFRIDVYSHDRNNMLLRTRADPLLRKGDIASHHSRRFRDAEECVIRQVECTAIAFSNVATGCSRKVCDLLQLRPRNLFLLLSRRRQRDWQRVP